MSKPLALPELIKRSARALRDNPATNRIITSALRPGINQFPDRSRKALMSHFPRVGRVSALMPDGKQLKLECYEPESILNSVYYEGWIGEEPEVIPLWYELAKYAEVVVDIGAHIGHFSLVAGMANPRAKIFSFEPLPRIADVLRRNVEINGLKNIDVRPRALAQRAGTMPFFAIPDGLPSSSSLSEAFMTAGHNKIVATEVEVSTLDAESLPTTAPVLIKIDTETTEPDVIAGGAAYLRSTRPLIIVEILESGSGAERLSHALEQACFDFDAYRLTGEGPVAITTLTADPVWRNYLLVPKDRTHLAGMNDVLTKAGIKHNP